MIQSKSLFSRMNPFVCSIYFLVIMVFTVCFMHPFVLAVCGLAAFGYSVYLGGRKQCIYNIKLLLVIPLTGCLNPLLNHQGTTILCYLNQNPVTQESIVYGFVAGTMLYDILLECSVFHKIMTSDKIICVLSKTIPVFALLFTVSLRFVPLYKAHLKKIRFAQKGIGYDSTQGNVIERIIHGTEILSGLITWALENALETADSMKSRGFGLKGRTYFTNSRMTRLDKQLIELELFLLFVFVVGNCFQCFKAVYFPEIIISWRKGMAVFTYAALFLFTILPVAVDLWEEVVWHLSRQKI